MKRWEEEQRQKAYQTKIKNAKAQVPPSSNPKTSSKIKDSISKKQTQTNLLNESVSSQRSSISGYFSHEKEDKNSIPLYRLLKLHNLQQYAQYLIGRGFGYDLTQFQYLSPKALDDLTQEMKIMPGHKTKFLGLLGFISDLLPQMSQQSPYSIESQINRSNSNIVTKNSLRSTQNDSQKHKRQVGQTKQITQQLKTKQSKPIQQQRNQQQVIIRQRAPQPKQQQIAPKKNMHQTLRVTNLGCDFFKDDDEMDDQFSKALDDILKDGILKQYQTQQGKWQSAIDPNKLKTLKPLITHAQDDIIMVPQIRGGRIELQDIPNKEQKRMRNLEKRLIGRMPKRSRKAIDSSMSQDYPDLEVSQVKLMYQSFDSGKLTSTLINLDIEEMSNCLGWALLKHIKFSTRKSMFIESQSIRTQSNNYLVKVSHTRKASGQKIQINCDISQNPIEEPTFLMGYNEQTNGLFESQTQQPQQSPILLNQQKNSLGCISEKTFENSHFDRKTQRFDDTTQFEQSRQQIEHILRESLVMMRPKYFQPDEEEESYLAGDLENIVDSSNEDEEEQDFQDDDSAIHKQEEENDSLRYEDDSFNYTQQKQDCQEDMELSLVSRFDIYDDPDESEKEMKIVFQITFGDEDATLCLAVPSQEVLCNYCKNIVITSKMEKEVTIICLVYVERLLVKSGFGLEVNNWRKIIFIALILASKIWDDESFENDNFAKAFPQYKTKQINEMERVFLQLIEYNLYVKQSEYAKYYFLLRTHVEQRKKSFPLRPLDLNTILSLQRNANRATRTFKETYQQPQNKSF